MPAATPMRGIGRWIRRTGTDPFQLSLPPLGEALLERSQREAVPRRVLSRDGVPADTPIASGFAGLLPAHRPTTSTGRPANRTRSSTASSRPLGELPAPIPRSVKQDVSIVHPASS